MSSVRGEKSPPNPLARPGGRSPLWLPTQLQSSSTQGSGRQGEGTQTAPRPGHGTGEEDTAAPPRVMGLALCHHLQAGTSLEDCSHHAREVSGGVLNTGVCTEWFPLALPARVPMSALPGSIPPIILEQTHGPSSTLGHLLLGYYSYQCN